MVQCAHHPLLKFASWKEYDEHQHAHHRVPDTKLQPVNHSGRTRKEIVSTAEATWLKPFLITDETVKLAQALRALAE